MERVFEACAQYRKAIDAAGAERVVAMLTSAVRDAANGAEFERELERRFGFEAQTISGEREARLTYLGATSARHHAAPDAGARHRRRQHRGGGRGAGTASSSSCRRSSARCATPSATSTPTRPRRPSSRPAARLLAPSSRRRCRARCASRCTRASRWPARRPRSPRSSWRSTPTTPSGWRGTASRSPPASGSSRELAALPLAERRLVTGLHPDRAPTIVAGGTILVEAMRLFGLDEIEVSERDILHGAALEAARNCLKSRPFRHFLGARHGLNVHFGGFATARVLAPLHNAPRSLGTAIPGPGSPHRSGRCRIVTAPPVARTAQAPKGTYPCPS